MTLTQKIELDNLVYKPNELVPILKIGKNRLNGLLRSGKLRSVRNGRKYLVPRDAVLDFLNGKN